mmetsp:Transcript_24935/g.42367  ORF Transcript_24935/g.42367 Transcript_24935/m.42367 type:complete len:91 (-) Transcript_24935:180-452(-)
MLAMVVLNGSGMVTSDIVETAAADDIIVSVELCCSCADSSATIGDADCCLPSSVTITDPDSLTNVVTSKTISSRSKSTQEKNTVLLLRRS